MTEQDIDMREIVSRTIEGLEGLTRDLTELRRHHSEPSDGPSEADRSPGSLDVGPLVVLLAARVAAALALARAARHAGRPAGVLATVASMHTAAGERRGMAALRMGAGSTGRQPRARRHRPHREHGAATAAWRAPPGRRGRTR